MDNQPAPLDVISCAQCFFSRVVRVHPQSLEKVRVCKWGPPTPILAMTQNGPTLLPSTQAPVTDSQWCFQFRPAENMEEISGDAAPKLLGGVGKTILQS